MSKNLIIVESPAKAKTIQKFIGKDYTVISSKGHVRDLPQKDLGIDISKHFSPQYEILSEKKKLITDIKKMVNEADTVWLATDDDQAELMNLARLGNKYLTETEPWKKQKEDPDYVRSILHISLQICASLSILCEPFLPFTAEKLQKMLNMSNKKWIDGGRTDLLKAGDTINAPEFLFVKVEDEAIAAQVKKLDDAKKANALANAPATPAKDDITYDEFQKMDLRVVTVLEAERVPKTKKLLKLKVNTGVDEREIVSGIAEFYEPEKLVGQQVLMLINLAPKEIKGVKSHGMVLMAANADGSLALMQPGKEVNAGSTVQ